MFKVLRDIALIGVGALGAVAFYTHQAGGHWAAVLLAMLTLLLVYLLACKIAK